MHGGYYFSLPEEVQRGEPSETRETQFRSCNCPGTRRKHQVFVPLLLGPRAPEVRAVARSGTECLLWEARTSRLARLSPSDVYGELLAYYPCGRCLLADSRDRARARRHRSGRRRPRRSPSSYQPNQLGQCRALRRIQTPTRAGRDGKRLSSTVYGYTNLLATPPYHWCCKPQAPA